MAKRLTDTNIWNKEWFHDLSPKMKCFVRYLDDHCDNAGVWDVNFKLAEFNIGEKVSDCLAELPHGFFYTFDNGQKWFMPKFIEIQNGDIFKEPKEGRKVSSIIQAVRNKLYKIKYKSGNLYEFYYALSIGQEVYKEEETYKEEEEYTGKGGVGEKPNPEPESVPELSTTERIEGIVIHDPKAPNKLWHDPLWRSSLHELFGIDDQILLPYWQEFWIHIRAGASKLDRRPIDKIREHFRNWLNKQDFKKGNDSEPEIDLSDI